MRTILQVALFRIRLLSLSHALPSRQPSSSNSALKFIPLEEHYDCPSVRSWQEKDGVYDIVIDELGSSFNPTIRKISLRISKMDKPTSACRYPSSHSILKIIQWWSCAPSLMKPNLHLDGSIRFDAKYGHHDARASVHGSLDQDELIGQARAPRGVLQMTLTDSAWTRRRGVLFIVRCLEVSRNPSRLNGCSTNSSLLDIPISQWTEDLVSVHITSAVHSTKHRNSSSSIPAVYGRLTAEEFSRQVISCINLAGGGVVVRDLVPGHARLIH